MCYYSKIIKYDPGPFYKYSTIHISERNGNVHDCMYNPNLYFIFTYNEQLDDWRLTYFINRTGKIIKVNCADDINETLRHIAFRIKTMYLRKEYKIPEKWTQYTQHVKLIENE